MKPAAKQVEQSLSLPCQHLECGLSVELRLSDKLGRSEVARASRRAASASGPTLARTESPRLPPLSPASKQPPRSPTSPWSVLLGGSSTAKVCQKTRESDAFLPTANPPASKKVFENKDTIG